MEIAMVKRAIHYEPDADESDRTFCGTDGEFEQQHFTAWTAMVTCKRCRRILEKIQARRDGAAVKSKSTQWDWLSARSLELGYPSLWDALSDLHVIKGKPPLSEF
jgi:hypothetical protein